MRPHNLCQTDSDTLQACAAANGWQGWNGPSTDIFGSHGLTKRTRVSQVPYVNRVGMVQAYLADSRPEAHMFQALVT